MAIKSQEEVRKAVIMILSRAAKDAAFNKLCVTNPAAACKQATGEDIPPNFKIRFVENMGANLTLVLPDMVDASGELKDAELEQVAGGGRCAASCAASCAVSSCICFPLPSVTGVVGI